MDIPSLDLPSHILASDSTEGILFVGARGNVATEDVLYMLNGTGVDPIACRTADACCWPGIETGIDMDKLLEVHYTCMRICHRLFYSQISLLHFA